MYFRIKWGLHNNIRTQCIETPHLPTQDAVSATVVYYYYIFYVGSYGVYT